jgi:hypothetical protein
MDMASRQRFSVCGESRCAYKLRLPAPIYAQMYAQSWGQTQTALSIGSVFRIRSRLNWWNGAMNDRTIQVRTVRSVVKLWTTMPSTVKLCSPVVWRL